MNPDQSLAPGTLLENRYRILRLLGQGGMSRVYLADATHLGMQVAVKENLQTGVDARVQFEREAQMLARLSHPNIPRVMDRFTDSTTGRQYLVMEYVEGEDLAAMVKRVGALPEATALNWIRQILGAVEYLHSQQPPVIHRDIKPANIKITPQGKATLVDFGIAKVYDPNRGTVTGMPAVTPGYAPPEQYGFKTTQRSDIYALGATLYTMLTGRVPPEDPLRQAGEEPLLPPRRIVPISGQTESVILHALEVENTRRWQSVAELRAALDARVSQPSRASEPQVGPQTLRKTSKVPALLIPLAAVSIGLICILGVLLASALVGPSTPAPTSIAVATTTPLATATSSLPAATSAVAFQTDAVVQYSIDFRTRPSFSSDTQGMLTQGQTLKILGRSGQPTSVGGGDYWIQVVTDAGKQGWVQASQVKLNIPLGNIPVVSQAQETPTVKRESPTGTPTPKPQADAIVQYTIDFRTGPGFGYDTQGTLSQGQGLKVIGRYTQSVLSSTEDWLQVITESGKQGWVQARQVSLRIPLSSVPLAQLPATATPTSVFLLADDFVDNRNGWREVTGKSYFENGTFHVKQTDAGYSYWPYCRYCGSFSDFVYEAQITKVEGPDDLGYGMTFRGDTSNNFYKFGVSGNGYYQFSKLVSNSWQTILGWTKSNAITQGNNKNKLRVVCRAAKFDFYVNDQFVASATDDTFSSGLIGVGVDKEGIHIRVDYVRVWRAAPVSVATPIPAATATPTIPPGMGGLIVTHEYNDEMNYDIGGKLYKIPPGGIAYIYLAPGRYTFSWNTVRDRLRPLCNTSDGCTVVITVGQYYIQNWHLVQ